MSNKSFKGFNSNGFIGVNKDNGHWQVLVRNVFTKKSWIFVPIVSILALAIVEFFQRRKYKVSKNTINEYLELLLSVNAHMGKGNIDIFKPNGFWIVNINSLKRYKNMLLSPLTSLQALAITELFQTLNCKVLGSEDTDMFLKLLLEVNAD
jgi:hypothetical protein